MGTPALYTLHSPLTTLHSRVTLNDKTQDAEGLGPHQTSEPVHRPGRPGGSQEGREAVPARGGQAAVGLHQGEEAAGPGEQTVLQAGQEDGEHLRKGQSEGVRHGQTFEGPSDELGEERADGELWKSIILCML